jgi:hypothetical protein
VTTIITVDDTMRHIRADREDRQLQTNTKVKKDCSHYDYDDRHISREQEEQQR